MTTSVRNRAWRPEQLVRFATAVQRVGKLLRDEANRIKDPSLELMAEHFYLYQYEELHRCIDHLVPDGATALDWGAGVGHAAFTLAHLGRRVTAYSPPETAYNCYNPTLSHMAVHGGFDVAIGTDPHAIPLADESFDAIIGCGVLEHVRESGSDDRTALLELRRLLKPSGKIFLMHLPSRHSVIEFMNRRRGRGHMYTYDIGTVHGLAASAGLHVIEHWHYGFLPKLFLASLRAKHTSTRPLLSPERYYALDRIVSDVFGRYAQNHFVVLQRMD